MWQILELGAAVMGGIRFGVFVPVSITNTMAVALGRRADDDSKSL